VTTPPGPEIPRPAGPDIPRPAGRDIPRPAARDIPRPAGRAPTAVLDRAGGAARGGTASFGFIALMAALGAINAFSTDVVIPALGAISDEFALTDPNHRQWMLLSLFVGVAFSQLLIGPIADSFGRRTAAAVNITTYVIGTLIALFSTSFALLLVGRTLQGLGSGGLRVITMAVNRDRFSGDEMARVVSLSSAVFVLIILLAPAIGQLVISVAPWRWLFVVLLAQVAITATWFFVVQAETLKPENRRKISLPSMLETYAAVLGNRVCVGHALAMAMMFGAFVGYLATSQQIFAEIYGLGDLLPVAFGVLAAMNGAASLVNARMVRRIGARAISRLALIACAVSGLIGAAVFWAGFAGVPPLWLHMVWIAIPISAFGALYGNLAALALAPMGARAGTASAMIAAFGSGAGVLVAWIGGAAFNGTLVPLYLSFGLAGAGGLICMRFARPGASADERA
jgi:DHA1 family bicyclomycin/chloramphenicol resistance-like MFS transporter